MRILVFESPVNSVVAQEYIDDDAEGTFTITSLGQVVYHHVGVGEIFANTSLTDFLGCAHAWERYRADVKGVAEEEAQMRIVEQLERSLAATGGLHEAGFWSLNRLKAGSSDVLSARGTTANSLGKHVSIGGEERFYGHLGIYTPPAGWTNPQGNC